MHSLHYCVMLGHTAEEAEAAVDSEVQGFGDENSWYTICGSICETGEVHRTGEGRFQPDDDMTLDKINQEMQACVSSLDCPQERDALAIMQRLVEGKMPENVQVWYVLQQYAVRMFDMHTNQIGRFSPGGAFNVLTNNFMDGCFDEVGVTNMVDTRPGFDGDVPAPSDTRKRYVVFLDMHS